MRENDFSFCRLLEDIRNQQEADLGPDPRLWWEGFECLVTSLVRSQDWGAKRQANKYPDILLSDGFGIETKLITGNINKPINLNSSPPGDTCYICGYHNGDRIEHVVALHARNLLTPEMDDIVSLHQPTQVANNPLISFRVRLMLEIKSPFKVYGTGFRVVDKAGGIIEV